MMIHAAFWFVQDFLAVLTWGAMRVPEIFLLSLIYRLFTDDRDINVAVIWTAFFGGLLWDLRWIGVPGFFALAYVAVVMAAIWVWNSIPASGRTTSIVFFLFWASQFLPALLSTFLVVRNVGWSFFWIQQACTVPAALVGVFLYTARMKEKMFDRKN